jgi:phenylpropionate dioxygenase-like ring-hydroxylating dioxygenase large terminal subunit
MTTTAANPSRARLASDLDRGLSLPASWYTDPAFVEQERERIFRHTWQYIGRAEQLARPGDFITGSAGEIPIVVVRSDGGLKGFVNVCRHRRHEVMSGTGNKQLLQCPYHAWTYDLEGCLKTAPRSEREEAFHKEDYPLLSVLVDVWGPWVFVNPDLHARPLTHFLGELPQIIANSGLNLMQLKFYHRKAWASNANWKVMIENYLECYHCPIQHPGFSAVIAVDPDAYSLRSYEWFASQVGSVRAAVLERKGQKRVYDARGAITQAQYHFFWPNFTLNINPGHPNLSLDVWCPDSPGRTRGFSEQYFGPDVPEDWATELMAFNDQVAAEDDRLTDAVQRGLQCGLPTQGRFLLQSEHLVVHFQKLVLAALS